MVDKFIFLRFRKFRSSKNSFKQCFSNDKLENLLIDKQIYLFIKLLFIHIKILFPKIEEKYIFPSDQISH